MKRFLIALTTALLSTAAQAQTAATPAQTAAAPAPVDAATMEKAKTAYTTAMCVTCHQPTGQGIPGAFPPIVDSAWIKGNPDRIIAQVLKGMMGEIEVKGVKYNGVMPPAAHLDDETIALAITYARANPDFKNASSAVTAAQVKVVREKLKDKPGMWTPADLLKAYPLEEAKPAAPAATPEKK